MCHSPGGAAGDKSVLLNICSTQIQVHGQYIKKLMKTTRANEEFGVERKLQDDIR
jgi:hypothetical protein